MGENHKEHKDVFEFLCLLCVFLVFSSPREFIARLLATALAGLVNIGYIKVIGLKMNTKEFQQRLQKIEGLVRNIESAVDPVVRASAVELMQSLMELHGAGIERIMEITFDTGTVGSQIIDRFADDPLVASLLLLYGLHPADIETRVIQALEKVRPYLQSHGGNVELLGIADGVIHLRLQGSCNGCASSAMTLKLAIEEAIYEAAPDLTAIEVEGVVEQPPSGLVQLGKGREKRTTKIQRAQRSES